MRLQGKSVLFGKFTEGMKEDVLQAILNLERSNDPNFMKIKEWLGKEHEVIIPEAAYSMGLGVEMTNALKGVASTLGSICFYFQEPKMALNQHLTAKKQVAAMQGQNPNKLP